jgi:mRNA interferase MazF
MKRGGLVSVTMQDSYSTARPALIIQSDLFSGHPSGSALPVTSILRGTPLFRVPVEPDGSNASEVMVDKMQPYPVKKLAMCLGTWQMMTC